MDAKTVLALVKQIPRDVAKTVDITVTYNDDESIWFISLFKHHSIVGENSNTTEEVDGISMHTYEIYKEE